MIKALQEIIARVENWPKDRQADALGVLETMEAIGSGVYALSEDERADMQEALEEVRRGEVASEQDAARFFASRRQ
jgi:hypothetical protein